MIRTLLFFFWSFCPSDARGGGSSKIEGMEQLQGRGIGPSRFVSVIPSNPKQQGASRLSYSFGGVRQKEASNLLALAAALHPAWESLLTWMSCCSLW